MNRFRTVLLLIVVFVLLALAGPRVEIDQSWTETEVPADVDAWLMQKESEVPNLRPALQKRILWADSSHSRTPFSVVYLHGFSSSRMETAPFADSIAAELGANLYYTRFRGHGQDGAALGSARAQEWIQDTVESIRVAEAIGDSVVIVATSTGATLAAWAMARPELSQRVSGQVWVSPNFAPLDSRSTMLLWPWGRNLLKVIQGDSYGWVPQNALHDSSSTYQFSSDVLLEMMGLVDVVQHQSFKDITVPTFMIYSPTDLVIDHEVSLRLFDDIDAAHKDTMVVVNALDVNNHVIVGDALGPENTDRVARRAVQFLNARRLRP
jgi:esterase/lipase